jgi:hypothetical protein
MLQNAEADVCSCGQTSRKKTEVGYPMSAVEAQRVIL